MAYAHGRFAISICDRCGFEYPYHELIEEWNGARVCRVNCFEVKHPQLNPNIRVSDPEALYHSRPDRIEPPTERILAPNPFRTGIEDSSLIIVREVNHRRIVGEPLKFRMVVKFNGFSSEAIERAEGHVITTILGPDNYAFKVEGELSTEVGNGGGMSVIVGPLTLRK